MRVCSLLLSWFIIFIFLLQVSLSVWRDEAHGLVNGKKVADDEANEPSDEEAQQNVTSISRPSSSSARAEHASSSSPSRPPSSATEIDDEDDFDIDAVLREEVERSARERGAGGQSQDQKNKGKGKMIVADEDEYDTMWNKMDPIFNAPASTESSIAKGGSGDEDLAMWDAVDALEEEGSAAHMKPVVSQSPSDVDEDMWDVVKEMEDAPVANPPPATEVSIAAPSQDDDDWEDMYV